MTKPIINLDDVTFDDVEANGLYTSSRALVTGQRGESGLRKIFRAENTVDYYDREPT